MLNFKNPWETGGKYNPDWSNNAWTEGGDSSPYFNEDEPYHEGEPTIETTGERYIKFLEEGVDRLITLPFGLPIIDANPNSSSDKFDKDYWYKTEIETGAWALELLENRQNDPESAILNIFNKQELWQLDCKRFIELVHIYAKVKTYPQKFNAKYGDQPFRLYTFDSTSVFADDGWGIFEIKVDDKVTFELWKVSSDGSPRYKVAGTIEDYLSKSPVGTRIALRFVESNLQDYSVENAIKLGDDLFGAHGFVNGVVKTGKNKFTLNELKEVLAQTSYNASIHGNFQTFVKENVFLELVQPINTDAVKAK